MSKPVQKTLSDPEAHHPRLSRYWPSERRAILAHRFYLSIEGECTISIECAIQSWESGAGRDWRADKARRDGDEQMREIERHKYLLSQQAGHDVGWELAAKDWVARHAAEWRRWWEEREDKEG